MRAKNRFVQVDELLRVQQKLQDVLVIRASGPALAGCAKHLTSRPLVPVTPFARASPDARVSHHGCILIMMPHLAQLPRADTKWPSEERASCANCLAKQCERKRSNSARWTQCSSNCVSSRHWRAMRTRWHVSQGARRRSYGRSFGRYASSWRRSRCGCDAKREPHSPRRSC